MPSPRYLKDASTHLEAVDKTLRKVRERAEWHHTAHGQLTTALEHVEAVRSVLERPDWPATL